MSDTPTTKSVLIIEDDLQQQAILQDRFKREGLLVHIAKNGKEGLQTALLEHPDVIVLDIMLPRMDGREVVEHLQKDEWGRTVPVLVLTNKDSVESIGEMLTTGVFHYLVKNSSSIEQIIDKVKAMVA
ncbi:response regulator [Candidatus Kaiserbacteria bacterium]|nr:response regulator [Candidatus Kaiserbacteria bacterium]